MTRLIRRRFKKHASSLVVTLLVIVVLSTIVVAFMQSMSIERKTAKSLANQYRAVLVSDAAVQTALQSLIATTNSGPYSTIYSFPPGTNTPYLFQAKQTNLTTSVGLLRYPQFTTLQAVGTFSNTNVPIISTNSYSVPDFEQGSSVSRSVSSAADIYLNINATNKTFLYGQIGLVAGTNSVAIPVNWIYFRDKDGTVIGRYAYWVDDECSKIDLRYAGNRIGSGSTYFRGNGTNVNEVSVDSLTNSGLSSAFLTNLFAFKANTTNRLAISEARYGSTNIPEANWQLLRGYLTRSSLHDDRAPDGRRKLNLNSVIATTNSPTAIQQQVAAIRDAILTNLPTFGTRYFQATAPTLEEQTNYVTKLSANIRDFVDADRNATVILDDGSASTNNAPNFVPYELLTTDIPMFGKERVPHLNEYLRVARVVAPSSASDTAPDSNLRNVTIRMGNYVELYNLSPVDITFADLGPNPFVCLANRTSWINRDAAGSPGTLRPVDVRIYLPSNFVIPANGYAVLTTDGPPFADSQAAFLGPAGRYLISRLPGDTDALETPQAGTWQAVNAGGQTAPSGALYEDYVVSTSKTTSNRYNFQCFGTASPSYADCRERILFGNDAGLFDYNLRIYTVASLYLGFSARNPQYAVTFVADGNTSSKNAPGDSASQPRFVRGDPRANSESITLDPNTSATWKSGGAVYGDSFAHNTANSQETLGEINFNLNQSQTPLYRSGWTEYTADISGNHLVANTNLVSLGQLGWVYDPARYDADGFRGGSRTLRIGQSDDPGNNRNGNSSVANDMNWMGGLGSTNLATTNSLRNAGRLLDVFRTDDIVTGRINPNGIARGSNNPAIFSILHNYTFSTNTMEGSSSVLSGQALLATNLMSAMQAKLSNSLPFFGVGEVSSLSIFNAGSTLAGVDMTTVSDAGKEEFFRRTANLMATESLAFTVVSKAQAGSFRGDKFYPQSTVTRETTVQLVPTYPPNQNRPLPSSWQVRVVKDMFY